MFRENRFPLKNQKNLTGAVLAEIVDVSEVIKSTYTSIRVSLKVSNLEVQNKECTINIFEKSSSGVEIPKFMEFFPECSIEELKGKLFYAELGLNHKGYLHISKLFFIAENLIFDPRIKKTITYDNEEDFDIFSD